MWLNADFCLWNFQHSTTKQASSDNTMFVSTYLQQFKCIDYWIQNHNNNNNNNNANKKCRKPKSKQMLRDRNTHNTINDAASLVHYTVIYRWTNAICFLTLMEESRASKQANPNYFHEFELDYVHLANKLDLFSYTKWKNNIIKLRTTSASLCSQHTAC